MIGWLSGTIIALRGNWLILDVNGVGYRVQLKVKNLKLKIGNKVEFYTHHYIREDRQELYGFETLEELELFELLLGVSGVGPKVAMNVLAAGKVEEIFKAIEGSNQAFFQAIPGLGKKVAAKIIVELRSKVGAGELLAMRPEDEEVIAALKQLGYRQVEVGPLMGKIPADRATTQEKITWLLKHLAK